MRILIVCATLSTLALAACSDASVGPRFFAERAYILESVDGLSLPAIFEASDITLTALSGTLVLDSTGSSTWLTDVHQVPDNFGDGNYVTSKPGLYRFKGDSIEIGYFGECRDICIANRTGVVTDSTLTLYDPQFMGGGHTFTYRLLPAQH